MSRRARRSVNKSGTAAALAAALITLTACFGTGENLPRGDGRITGVLYDQSSGAPLEGVTVTMDNRGGTCAATTESDGSFSLDTGMVVRGEGYNVRFYLQNYQHASRAAVFQLPNLRVDLGRVDLYDSGPVEERTVTGRILDNLSDDGLADAGVSVQVTYAPLPGGDTVTETYVALTDGQGNFRVTGKGFMLHSSYVLTVSKTNYITRSDVTVLVAGSSSVMDGGAAHLILNFGNIAGTVIDDSGTAPLAGARVSAVDGLGNEVSGTTGPGGEFLLESEHFYLGRDYTVSIAKDDYFPASAGVYIAHTEIGRASCRERV